MPAWAPERERGRPGARSLRRAGAFANVGRGDRRARRSNRPAARRPRPGRRRGGAGASCTGPVYELAFGLDHLLRRRKLRHRVPITVLTPEPFVGHMGIGGAGKIRQLLEGALEERDITYRTSVAISRIADDAVETGGASPVRSVCSIVIPPLAGVDAVARSPGPANPKGLVPVDDHCRHLVADGVYAVGVAVALPPVGETPVPVNFPKTGHMTEQMAEVAACDLAARIDGREGPTTELAARCVLDMGDRGVYMAVDPVRPPGTEDAHHGRLVNNSRCSARAT